MALNSIVIQGRMVRDPELKSTPGGTSVTSFTLAVERDFKDKETGKRSTDFVDCVAWRNTAEFVSKYLTKGRMAVAVGRLQIRDYTDKDGNKRRISEVVADSVYLCDSANGGAGQQAEPVQSEQFTQPTQFAQTAPVPRFEELNDEDLPF